VKNFPGPFCCPRIFKYNEKTSFTHNIHSQYSLLQSAETSAKKQNVDISSFQKSDEFNYIQ